MAQLALVAAMGVLVLPATAFAAPTVAWQSEPGDIGAARGLAADEETGEIFVSDQAAKRLIVLGPWGQLLRTWGWDVVQSGPGDTAEGKLEVCVPVKGDVCKEGISGTAGTGQFNNAMGIALDSEGNVWVAEAGAPRRVQKFTPEGEFLLSLGGGVNQGGGTPESPGNLCTKEHIENGDVCGAGSTGAGPAEFSGPGGALRTVIAIAPDDKVWVGDKDRIQRFDVSGVHQDQCSTPGEQTQQVAVDSAGFLYVSYEQSTNDAKPDAFKIDPATCEQLPSPVFKAKNPRAIAVDRPTGDVYVFEKDFSEVEARIRHFDSEGNEVEPPFGEGLNRLSTGLAVGGNGACGIEGPILLHSNNNPGFVRAFDVGDPGGALPDPDLCPRPLVPPVIADSFAEEVGVTDATVGALINPRFWEDTTYRVQYGTEACVDAGGWEAECVAQAPASPALLTSEVANQPLRRGVVLAGLEPDTPYRFRFIAQSTGGGPTPTIGEVGAFTTFPPNPDPRTDCPNQAFRIGLSAHLPDCRAYEMVSPDDKNGGDVRVGMDIPNVEQIYPQASLAGEKLAYSSSTSFADADGAPFVSQYIAHRSGGGWSTEAISPAREKNIPGGPPSFLNNQFLAFSEDLCQAWLFWDGDPPLGDPPVPGMAGFNKLYERRNCAPAAGSFAPLIRSAPPNAPHGTTGFEPELQGLSADGSHAVYRANDALAVDEGPEPVAGAPGTGSNDQLYEFYDGGKVRLVSVLPGDPGAASGADTTLGLVNAGDFSERYRFGRASNAVSDDGETIFWTASGLTDVLYARLGGEETVQVSAGIPSASFWAAASDGSAALYSQFDDLILYDVASAERTTLTSSGFVALVGASEDLSRAYLVADEALDGEPNSEGDVAQNGAENLFLWEEGEEGGFSFVATLAGLEGSGFNAISAAHSRLSQRISRVSPDGAHLAFMSRAALTDYDNADAAHGRPDTEVYRYAAEEGTEGKGLLACVSCNPSGARPQGAELGVVGRGVQHRWSDIAGLIPGHVGHFHASRVLSADGQRLYFESFDALLPRDTNGARDVYQWQAPGKGDCDASDPHFFASNHGCIALISSGKGEGDADFIDATPSGSDVFFRTGQSLVSSDSGLVDVYDARTGGGFAPPPPEKAACEGDACQPASSAPEPPTPATSVPSQAGSQQPANPCRRAARRAKRLSGAAKRARRALRRAARRNQAAKARRMRPRARGLAKRARRNSQAAKRCRAARKANTSGRAVR